MKICTWVAARYRAYRRKRFREGYNYGMATLIKTNGKHDPVDGVWPDDRDEFDRGIIAASRAYYRANRQ